MGAGEGLSVETIEAELRGGRERAPPSRRGDHFFPPKMVEEGLSLYVTVEECIIIVSQVQGHWVVARTHVVAKQALNHSTYRRTVLAVFRNASADNFVCSGCVVAFSIIRIIYATNRMTLRLTRQATDDLIFLR